MNNAVNHPDHYNGHPSGIETRQISELLCHNMASALEYWWRHESKGKPREDLEKALWNVRREYQLWKDPAYKNQRTVNYPAHYTDDLYVLKLCQRFMAAEPDKEKASGVWAIAMGSFRTYYQDLAAEAIYKRLERYDFPDEAQARADLQKHCRVHHITIKRSAAGVGYIFTRHFGCPDFYTDGMNVVADLALVERCLMTFRK